MDILSIFFSKLVTFVIIIIAESHARKWETRDHTCPVYNYDWSSESSSIDSESELSLSDDSEYAGSDESWYSDSSSLADDYVSDVDEILRNIKNENEIISHEGKTWSDACRKSPEADLCESHPYEMLRACVDMAERITSNRDGYKFTFPYIITGDGIKCEELGITGTQNRATRPMYQCPNMRIQTDLETIRLPIFYISQSCQGDYLYAFRRTGEYKLVEVMGEWTQFQVEHSPPDSPMPPTGVWLLYKYNKRKNYRSLARAIKYKERKQYHNIYLLI